MEEVAFTRLPWVVALILSLSATKFMVYTFFFLPSQNKHPEKSFFRFSILNVYAQNDLNLWLDMNISTVHSFYFLKLCKFEKIH
jgi:hypothetical protein